MIVMGNGTRPASNDVKNAVYSALASDASVNANGRFWAHVQWTMAALGIASLALAPIAYWRFNIAGIGLVAGFALWIALACWAANLVSTLCARAGHAIAGPLVGSGVRMALPLVAALWIIVFGDRFAPVESLLLMVPLYLSALATETLGHRHSRHQANQTEFGSSQLPSVGSHPSGQG